VSWSAPASSNNAAISRYRVEYWLAGASAAAGSAYTTTGTELSLQVVDARLTVTQSFTFKVYAENLAGEGLGSASSAARLILPALAGAPTNVAAVPLSPTELSITWVAPTVSPNNTVTSYIVEVSSDGGTSYVAITTTGGGTITAISATAIGLLEHTAYLVRVTSVNQSGELVSYLVVASCMVSVSA
jgi:titin